MYMKKKYIYIYEIITLVKFSHECIFLFLFFFIEGGAVLIQKKKKENKK